MVMWATSTVEVTRTSTTLWPHQTHTYDRTIIKRACSAMIHSQCAHKGDCYGSRGRSTPNWRTVIDCGSIVVLCVPPTTRARAFSFHSKDTYFRNDRDLLSDQWFWDDHENYQLRVRMPIDAMCVCLISGPRSYTCLSYRIISQQNE